MHSHPQADFHQRLSCFPSQFSFRLTFVKPNMRGSITASPYIRQDAYMTLGIDSMLSADWPAVREIYLEGIATAQATFETQAPSWEAWDASHLPFARLVGREDETILGWAAVSPVSSRRAYF